MPSITLTANVSEDVKKGIDNSRVDEFEILDGLQRSFRLWAIKYLDDLLKRLNRIEGQVRGVKKMLEEDRYCVDILTQVSAINSALNSFNKVLLAEHIKSCVVDDIRAGKEEAVDELCATLQKLMK